MAGFGPLLDLLAEVPDPRRAQGKLYSLPHVLLFSIFAIVTGCNSSRGIVTFIDVHRRKLNEAFGLTWRRAPAHTAIRYILQRLDPAAVEASFRRHAALLQAARATSGQGSIALDGKTLRGSFDNFRDRAAAQVLSAFATDTALVLAHIDIAEKSNEIPAAQKLLAELGLADGAIVTHGCSALPKKTFEVAAEANIALIVQVKDNQPTLNQKLQEIAATTAPIDAVGSRTKGRNRDERRTVTVFDPAEELASNRMASARRRDRPRRTQSVHPHRVERPVGLVHRDRLLRLEHNAHRCERSRRHSRSLEDRDHIPLQPRRHIRRGQITYPHQPRRVCSPSQLRLQHPQVKQDQHAQPGPLPRRSGRHR